MPQVINTNVASLNSQRNLNSSQSALATSLQRLSSGLRINSAKDDAAGMAIADRMTSQIRGLSQAARNANDGISLAQTAEGGLSSIGDNLQRMRELAIQSANSTNSASDRASLNSEAQSLLAEISRVASTTQFNGLNLLDGTFNASQFQVGANAHQTISVSMAGATTDTLGSFGGTGGSVDSANGFTTSNYLTINGTQIGVTTDRSTQSPGWTVGSAAAKAAAINAAASTTGVTATATTAVTGSAPIAGSTINAGDLSINGVSLGAIAAQTTGAAQGQTVAAAINNLQSQTGVTATYNSSTGALSLSSSEGRDIKLTAASNAAATRVLNATGLTVGGTGAAAGTSTMTFGATAVDDETVVLNGVTFTFDANVASGTNTVVDATHVTVGSTGALATDTTMASNFAAAITAAKSDSKTQAALISVSATAAAGVTTITDTRVGAAATIGRTLTETITGGTANASATGTDVSGGTTTLTTGGTLTLNSSTSFTLTGGGNGLTYAGLSTLTVAQSKLSAVSLSTVSGANSAISVIDAALAQVNTQRGDLGAIQNRFSATVTNLQTSSENISAARSRIQDADFASETAALTRNQILQQAGTAMLSQANALPQNVLSLLRG